MKTIIGAKEQEDAIALKGGFDGVVLRKTVDGELIVDASCFGKAPVKVITRGSVQHLMPATEPRNADDDMLDISSSGAVYRLGDVLPNKWIVGPVSPDTGKPLVIEPVSLALGGHKSWDDGDAHIDALQQEGFLGARRPSIAELKEIYNAVVVSGRNDQASFNRGNAPPFGVYWSSTIHSDEPDQDRVDVVYFDDGRSGSFYKGQRAILRCVRDADGLNLA